MGRLEGLRGAAPSPLLRKRSRIRTVHGSAAIEGNPLSAAQVTAVLEGKRVAASPSDLREVLNANAAYERAGGFRPWSVPSMLEAHRLLMGGLLSDAGRWPTTAVGVLSGTRVRHLAPPAWRVDALVRSLLGWARATVEPRAVVAAVVHYELLFIHPFTDGNGRLARLWQHVILTAASPVFGFVPVESIIRERQRQYYRVLAACDRAGDSTAFVELMVDALGDAVESIAADYRPGRGDAPDRVAVARAQFARRWFSRAEYLALHRGISAVTASRDLAAATRDRRVERRGDKRLARYRFR